jgi:predicted O-linked N-acetylglucosamine transferase (SPINDLY family)
MTDETTDQVTRRIEADLAQGAGEAASARAKAHVEAGGVFSDVDWCRWVLWDKASFASFDEQPDGAPPRAIIRDCLTGWPVVWSEALAAVPDPTPTLTALQALLAAARQELPINFDALDRAATIAETPWLHYLVGTGYRYLRNWGAAERHLKVAMGTPDLLLPATMELLLVYAQSAQLHAVARIFREHFSTELPGFRHLALNAFNIMLNAGDFAELYEAVVMVEELLQQHLRPFEQEAPFRNFSCLFSPSVTMDTIQIENSIYSKVFEQFHPIVLHPWTESADRTESSVRRIGYFFGMGNDFFSFPALRHRDRARYQTFFYFHNVPPGVPLLPDDAAACDIFRALGGMDDEAMVQTIVADDLDLLIVLDAVGMRARDAVVRRRPARRIAYYGNVFGPLATPAVDALLLPETMADCFAGLRDGETIVRMPDWMNLVGANNGRFLDPFPVDPSHPLTLGTPSNGMKLNQGWFDMAARLMKAVPDLHLRLDLPTISGFEFIRLHDYARRAEIDPQRMTFNSARYSIDFPERMSNLSLALDSFPMSCYFSAMQVLSAGLPLLTVPGAIPSGRGTATILNAANLYALICRDQAEMEAKALALLRQPAILTELRSLLPIRMRESLLNDLPRVARAWESALEQVLALPVRAIA